VFRALVRFTPATANRVRAEASAVTAVVSSAWAASCAARPLVSWVPRVARVARWVASVWRSFTYAGLGVRLWNISDVHCRATLGTVADAGLGGPATVSAAARAVTSAAM
jgi:hypothetical protein